jgi:hypothetical protein
MTDSAIDELQCQLQEMRGTLLTELIRLPAVDILVYATSAPLTEGSSLNARVMASNGFG